jgi:hypothetical protein
MIRRTRPATLLAVVSSLAIALVSGCTSGGDDPVPSGTGGAGGATAGGGAGGATAATGGTGGGAATGGSGGSGGAPGASGDGGAPVVAPADGYRTCTPPSRVGDLVVTVDPAFVSFGGQIMSAADTTFLPQEVKRVGACRLLKPAAPIPPCSPECGAGKICTRNGCIAEPAALDAGQISIGGTKTPFTAMLNMARVYGNPVGSSPTFDEGAALELKIAGKGDVPAQTIKASGIALLKAPTDKLRVESGKPVTLTWTPPTKKVASRMVIEFGVDLHGSSGARYECEVEDNGSFTIDAALVTELFSYGTSGFPRTTLTRQAAGTGMTKAGCVQFSVKSEVTRDIEIPGQKDCNEDSECPSGQKCMFLACK